MQLNTSRWNDDFILKLADSCETRSEWISLIQFGMSSLKKRSLLLLQLVILRAGKEQLERPEFEHVVAPRLANDVAALFQELQLFVCLDPSIDRGAD